MAAIILTFKEREEIKNKIERGIRKHPTGNVL
jgi:hypothetical protein